MHKPQIHQQKCSNQWHAETLNNEYRHRNVEISEAQIQKKIGVGSFVHMKENTTTVTKSYRIKLLQSYRRWISHSWEVYPEEKKDRDEEEGNGKQQCGIVPLEEEDMSWKTAMRWCINQSNKRKTQKNWHQTISTISVLNMHHHAPTWNDKRWKWD